MIGPGLAWVIEQVRKEPDGEIAHFGAGAPMEPAETTALVPADMMQALDDEGLLSRLDDGRLHLDVCCQAFNGLVSLLPARQTLGADFVHLNSDSFWLIDLIWKLADPGTWAVELGTGNGIVAAHLVARYRRVIGTDLPGAWMRYARLTLEANKGRGRPSAVIACDIASALRPGCFDLVVSNTPWSPNPGLDDNGEVNVFMDGGPTGTELPIRFIRQAADLLAPGGMAIMLCLDPTFDDGSRPLASVIAELEARGFGIELINSPLIDAALATARLQQRLPSLRHAAHVAMVIRDGRSSETLSSQR